MGSHFIVAWWEFSGECVYVIKINRNKFPEAKNGPCTTRSCKYKFIFYHINTKVPAPGLKVTIFLPYTGRNFLKCVLVHHSSFNVQEYPETHKVPDTGLYGAYWMLEKTKQFEQCSIRFMIFVMCVTLWVTWHT